MPLENLSMLVSELKNSQDYSEILDLVSASLHRTCLLHIQNSPEFKNYAFHIFSDRCEVALPASHSFNIVTRSELKEIFDFLLMNDRIGFPLTSDNVVEDLEVEKYPSSFALDSQDGQHAGGVEPGCYFAKLGRDIPIQAKNMEPVALMFGDIFSHPIIRNIKLRSIRREARLCENEEFFHALGQCDWCDIVRMRFPIGNCGRLDFNDSLRNFHFAVHAWHDTSKDERFGGFLSRINFKDLSCVPSEFEYTTWIEEANCSFSHASSDLTRIKHDSVTRNLGGI